MEIKLVQYGPIISDKAIGDEIYSKISDALAKKESVTIDFTGIKSMATFCAKQIFGRIYLELTPTVFFEKLILKNALEDVKLIIKIGIQNAIEEQV
jgi:hypothetical protein